MNPTLQASQAATAGMQADGSLEKRAYAKVFWRLVPFLMLCYVVAYLDRVNVGFAKLQMGQDLGFSETVFGLGAGIFFLGYFLFEVPSNLLLNRVGARIWIARIMITWGVLSACFVFVETSTSFYILRFLLGVAEAGFYPGVILYLTQWYPAHRRARIIAVFMSAIPVAGIFGNPLSGWIMDSFHGVSSMHGWQWMFLIEAAPAILVGIMVLLYLDNGIQQARWLDPDEKRLLQREVERDQAHGAKGPHSVAAVFRDARVWWMALIYFAFVMGQYALTFWLPTLVKATGVKGNLHIGLLSAIPFVCAIVAMNLFGRSADRRQERRWHRTPDDVQRIRAAIDALHAAVAAGGNGAEEDVRFHRAIAEAARNPFLVGTLQYLRQFLHGATRVTRANEARRADFAREVAQEHARIVEAIEAGDALRAREAAKSHMDNAIRRIEQADPAFWQQEGAQLARPLVEGWPLGS